MVFICLDHKVVELWVVHLWCLIRIKRKLFLQEHQIKESCLYVIGLTEVLMKQVVRMIQSCNIGIRKEILDPLLHLI